MNIYLSKGAKRVLVGRLIEENKFIFRSFNTSEINKTLSINLRIVNITSIKLWKKYIIASKCNLIDETNKPVSYFYLVNKIFDNQFPGNGNGFFDNYGFFFSDFSEESK